ncbi:hypothetical protein MKX03_024792 [Papaver bracteatum]|nr:hypothetical protein MKX03_024792 [Papaver bracteatum]
MEKNVSSESRQSSSSDRSPIDYQSDRSPPYNLSSSSSSSSAISSRKIKSSSSVPRVSLFPKKSSKFSKPFTPLPLPPPSSSSSSEEEIFFCRLSYQDRLNLVNLEKEYNEVDILNCLCCSHLNVASKSLKKIKSETVKLESYNEQLRRQLIALLELNLSMGKNGGGTGVDRTKLSHYNHQVVQSPTSELGKVVQDQSDRVSLPKSISIRSNAYLKMNQSNAATGTTAAPSNKTANRLRFIAPRVDDEKKEDPLELDVYNQGMSKTELCNKWIRDGVCQYGNQCQFAHGLCELRTVIRHPRYKTEACRNEGSCPYGHRCHYRHVLTDQEKRTGITHT